MNSRTAITVNRPPDEVERLWRSAEYRPAYIDESDAAVVFRPAPGDRGTEIHVDLEGRTTGGKLGVHSQLQALLFALRYGVVELQSLDERPS